MPLCISQCKNTEDLFIRVPYSDFAKTGFYLSIGDADKSPNSIRLRRDLLKDICRADFSIYNQKYIYIYPHA